MVPTIVLVSIFVALSLAARFGVRRLSDPMLRARIALAAMFFVTASAHWGSMRSDLVAMVPPSFPNPELIITLTGIAEIAGAIGLLIPRLAPVAGGALALLLVAMFPANVHAAQAHLTLRGAPVQAIVPRAIEQLLFLAAALYAAFGHRLSARARAADRAPLSSRSV